MNKAYVYGAGSAVLALVAGGLYARQKRMQKNEIEPSNIELAGVPDQLQENDLEQLENAKMVSEGSQFGVKYYNDAQEELKDLEHEET